MDHYKIISQQLHIPDNKTKATLELLDSGNTLPFIARYRKEVTGNLDEEQIRQISDTIKKLRTLDDRRQTVLASVKEQKKLTPKLVKQLSEAKTMTAVSHSEVGPNLG